MNAVVFAPSAKGLQRMLDICSKFAVTHNVTKSQCMIINSKFDLIHHPTFHLNGSTLPYTEKYKYLGHHIIISSLTDDNNVLRQTRSLYARANKIIRSFSFASLSVKLALFKAYFTPIYGCQLWSRLFQYSNRKLQVAYNDAFRQLLREPRWFSASRLFVYNNVPSFDAVVRKLVYCFWCSLCKSDNMLIQAG